VNHLPIWIMAWHNNGSLAHLGLWFYNYINKTEVPCWKIATIFARKRTQCNSSLWALCSWWVVHRRPVALAKLSIHTHHLSLFRVLWHLNFFSRPEYSWKIARWTLNINQSIICYDTFYRCYFSLMQTKGFIFMQNAMKITYIFLKILYKILM
jgi:hypothetical protein